MAKIRVHEIAKELGLQSKVMVDTLQSMGLDVKNHMSTIEESQANWVKKQLQQKDGSEEDKPEKNGSTSPGDMISGRALKGQQQPQISNKSQKTEMNKKEQPQPKKIAGMPAKNEHATQNRPKAKDNAQDQNRYGNKTQTNIEQNHSRGLQRIETNISKNRQPLKGQQPKTKSDNVQNANQGQNKRKPGNISLTQNLKKPQISEWTTSLGKNNDSNKKVAEKTKDLRLGKFDKNTGLNKKGAQVPFKKDYSRPGKKQKHKHKKENTSVQFPEKISIEELITVRDLAEKLKRSSADIVKKLMELGTMASINQTIDFDTAEIIASLYEVKVERVISKEEKLLEEIVDDESSLKLRPPIVTVMGHVDHGKTSLLDRIRKADVVSGEAGGITQHIGAYQVTVNGNKITFIDTPGHEAFTAMRARGANLTDIVVLVVAADDGVMPQTIEAINHIKAADVPFIVAINKIDKPDANPERVMQQLTEYGILAEEWGGDTIFVPVSAKKGDGIDVLLEMIILLAEIHQIRANPDRKAEGVVLEGQLDRGRGAVGTVLVLKGTLNIGDSLICGNNFCKVRAMTDHKGRRVLQAFPSMPVEITGWSEVPEAGGKVIACDEKVAKEIINLRLSEKKMEEQKQSSKVSLDDFFKQMQDNAFKELNLIIKGDVQGSIEALAQSLLRLSTDEVKVNVIHSAVGAISETDVMLATASQAIIIGFNVRPDVKARKYAEDEGIDVRLYRVIYEAIEDVKKAMVGLLEPEYREKYMGRAEVRATFKVPNVGLIAGSYVIDGKLQRNAKIRVLRDGVIVYEGQLSSLKRFKDDVREVAENYECGIGIYDFNDVKEGDIIEAFTLEEIEREL
ncbi:MAG: translation initiation factor IF-2 [Syntrophomonadaceae bacterium]|jgi:translation initiation factor IF-2